MCIRDSCPSRHTSPASAAESALTGRPACTRGIALSWSLPLVAGALPGPALSGLAVSYRHPAFCPCVEHPGSRSTWSQKIFLRIKRRPVTSLSSDLNRTPAPPSSAARGLNEGTTVGSRAARHRPVQRGLRRTPDCPSAVGAAAADSQGGRFSARPCRRWFLQTAELDVAALPLGGDSWCLAGSEQSRRGTPDHHRGDPGRY